MATSVVFSILPISSSFRVWAKEGQTKPQLVQFRFDSSPGSNGSTLPCLSLRGRHEISAFHVVSCLSSSSSSETKVSVPSTRLYVSGLSFRTTEESLRAAFKNFGQLVEVNLVMDKIAKRPRGFAFLRYKTEEESQNAIEGMHGKFLDGRVIFVEVAKPRSELRQGYKQDNKKQYRTPLQQSLED